MNIINIEHISKIYGEKTIYEDASFGIQQGDKIGIVGINGTGKSTLLRMIAGEETPDEGQIIRQNGLKIAYIPQNPVFPEGADIRSYALSERNGEDWQVESNLTELGITDLDQEIAHLSGGQKRRVVLAKTLAGDFDVLLLDEPTNHLDGEMITWLEEYLRGYRGTILMVTHDRYFLDRVTNRILEISRGKMYGYDADYSGFLELKAAREEMELASERKRQSILRMELEWAKRGCRARSTKQRARLERLEALKNGKAPAQDQTVPSCEQALWGQEDPGGLQLYRAEKPEAWDHRTERVREVHGHEADRRAGGAGFREDRDRGDGPDRIFRAGRAAYGRWPAGH